MRYRTVHPPWWWRPWLGPYYWLMEFWYRPRPVKVAKISSEEGTGRG